MKRFTALAAGLLMAGMSTAQAADVTSWTGSYFGLSAGINFLTSGKAQALARTPSDMTFHFHPGPAIAAAGGYKWESGLRTEFEASYRRNGAKDFNTNATPLTGHQDDISVFGNVFYDFASPTSRVTPYVGFGVGAVWAYWRKFATAASSQIVREPGGTRLGLQAIVGLSYAVNPGLDFTLDGRFKGSNGHEYAGVLAADSITSYQLRAASVMVGLRYRM